MRATPSTARLIADRYQIGNDRACLHPVAYGAMGRIWRLELGEDGPDRARWAVKELFWGADEASVTREIAFRDAAAHAGVRSPTSRRTRDETYLYELPAELGGGWVRVQSWVDGRAADPRSPAAASWIGETLGRLHRLAWVTEDPPDPWYDTAPTPARWAELAATAHAAGADWAADLAAMTGRLAELADLVSPVDPATMVVSHRDEQPDNVLVDHGGNHTLVDWDNVGVNAPDRVLGNALWAWHVHDGKFDAAQVHRTLSAYAAAGGTARLEVGSFATMVATYLNYLEVQARLALDGNHHADLRTRAAAEVRHLLTAPPTPDLINRLAAAA